MGWFTWNRSMPPSNCSICNRPLANATKAYYLADSTYAHALCLWEEEDKRHAAQAKPGNTPPSEQE